MQSCMYTAQGEYVCTSQKPSVVEPFYNLEKGNEEAKKSGGSMETGNNAVNSAVNLIESGVFCQATMYKDAKSKQISIKNFLKQCAE